MVGTDGPPGVVSMYVQYLDREFERANLICTGQTLMLNWKKEY